MPFPRRLRSVRRPVPLDRTPVSTEPRAVVAWLTPGEMEALLPEPVRTNLARLGPAFADILAMRPQR